MVAGYHIIRHDYTGQNDWPTLNVFDEYENLSKMTDKMYLPKFYRTLADVENEIQKQRNKNRGKLIECVRVNLHEFEYYYNQCIQHVVNQMGSYFAKSAIHDVFMETLEEYFTSGKKLELAKAMLMMKYG